MVEFSLRRPNRDSVRATSGRPVGMLIGVATGGVRKRNLCRAQEHGRKGARPASHRDPLAAMVGSVSVSGSSVGSSPLLAAKGSARCDGRVAFDGRGAMLARGRLARARRPTTNVYVR